MYDARLTLKNRKTPNTVNSIMGILTLVSLCYYDTMDNPYTLVITLIFSSRYVLLFVYYWMIFYY